MILVFGGTTEGRMVAQLLQTIQLPFFYSTKTGVRQDVPAHYCIAGAKNIEEIEYFCKSKDIKLIIDAAHPFASELHHNIAKVASNTGIETLRIEREPIDVADYAHVTIFDSFESLTEAFCKSTYNKALALTGVQTISKLQKAWQEKQIYFHILDTPHSAETAIKSGIDKKFIIPEDAMLSEKRMLELINETDAAVVLTKESGQSGGLLAKIKVTQQAGIPLWIIARPSMPSFSHTVFGKKQTLQSILALKKSILKEDVLRTGFTTGTCVCAALKACVTALEDGVFPEVTEVFLPDGTKAVFPVFPQELSYPVASCTVIKDAGDDPDITHAKEIGCQVRYTDLQNISFKRGIGIGIATLPGLKVPVGEPAINPQPRRMMAELIEELSAFYGIEKGFEITPFVPEGEKLALQTFNGRVGVTGGISILGTTGRVFPYSSAAFLDALRQQIHVASELGAERIVATSGKRSEKMLQQYCPNLCNQAFVQYGNFVGETIKIATEEAFNYITIGIMLGKASKLAEGHLDTHSREVLFNPKFAAKLASELGYPKSVCNKIKTLALANAIPDIIPFSPQEAFYKEIASRCLKVCRDAAPAGTMIEIALFVGENEPVIVQ